MTCCIMQIFLPYFCLMHMVEVFQFEFVAYLNLNQKEKIKREIKFRRK
jgi:hypothetical protein